MSGGKFAGSIDLIVTDNADYLRRRKDDLSSAVTHWLLDT